MTHPGLITGWAPRRADGWRNFLFSIRELRSYRSYLARPRSTPFYVRRWANYQTPNLQTAHREELVQSDASHADRGLHFAIM